MIGRNQKKFLLWVVSLGYELLRVVWPGAGLHVLSEHSNKHRVVDQVEIKGKLSKLIPLMPH